VLARVHCAGMPIRLTCRLAGARLRSVRPRLGLLGGEGLQLFGLTQQFVGVGVEGLGD